MYLTLAGKGLKQCSTISSLCSIEPAPSITTSPRLLGPSTMSSYAREMTVSHRQKRWKSAMSKDRHMDAHIVERDQRHF